MAVPLFTTNSIKVAKTNVCSNWITLGARPVRRDSSRASLALSLKRSCGAVVRYPATDPGDSQHVVHIAQTKVILAATVNTQGQIDDSLDISWLNS
jgi:hypothetical protein